MMTATDIVFEPFNFDDWFDSHHDWSLVGQYDLNWLKGQLGGQPELDEGITYWTVSAIEGKGTANPQFNLVSIMHNANDGGTVTLEFDQELSDARLAQLGNFFAGAFAGGRTGG